jgi:hypothetical protein
MQRVELYLIKSKCKQSPKIKSKNISETFAKELPIYTTKISCIEILKYFIIYIA